MTINSLKKLLFFCIIFIGISSCSEKPQRITIIKTETVYSGDDELRDIKFLEDDFGVACGDAGLLLITEDGGNTWLKNKHIPTEYPLSSVWIFSKSTFFIGSDFGTFKTYDGGLTWEVSTESEGQVFYINQNQGFSATNSQFYNLGDSYYWPGTPFPWNANIDFIYMLTATRGIAVSNDYSDNNIFITYNAGASWADVGGSSSTIVDVDFYDELHGVFATTSGDLSFTSDGGFTWQYYEHSPVTKSMRALDCIEMTSEVGYVVSGANDVAFCEDGSNITSHLNQDGNSIYFDKMQIKSNAISGLGIFNKEIIKFSK
jgi:photosystem II stability/assembly factor-like uncharacterized protein